LFLALVLSVAAAVPLAHAAPAFALFAIAALLASIGALAAVLYRTERAVDPRRDLMHAADRFDKRWPRFERDFWAHVAALDGTKA
jgi:hypothetical protein